MKLLPLFRNGEISAYAKVDNKDFGKLIKKKWFMMKDGRAVSAGGKRNKKILLHRFILGFPVKKEVDHKNGNVLDNRRKNLRICSHSENLKNMKMHKDNKSGIKGISWNQKLGYWVVQIKSNDKRIVKYFKNKKSAANKYKELSKLLHGNFGRFK